MTVSVTNQPTVAQLNPVVDGVNNVERQQLNFSGAPTGGTFTLTFGSITTSAITYSTTISTLQTNVQNALNSLFGANNTRAVVNSSTQVDILFGNALAGADI